MDNYKTNEKRKSGLIKFFEFLFIVVMLGISVALLLSYLAPSISPYKYWYIAFLGLAFPVLMLANIVTLVILGIRLSKWAYVPLITLLLGIGYISDYLQVSFVTKYESDQDKKSTSEFKIMTYNVHGFVHDGNDMGSAIQFINDQNPDIVCMQEFQLLRNLDQTELNIGLNKWKYRAVSYIVDNDYHRWGLAIFSKFPLRNGTAIKFTNKENSSMYVDALIDDDTVRLFNSHLQSTQFNTLNRQELRQDDPERAARLVGRTLRDNYQIREYQADTIRRVIDRSPYPTIVVGDFNDTPMSYVYSTMRGDMKDTFREKGEGYEYTYKPLKKLFRIDYILHNQQIETLSHESPDVPWSDHNPVIARIKINK